MSRFVLVHGAFGGAWSWGRVVLGLRAAGHEAAAIDLPGAGSDPSPLASVSLCRYAERVCDALSAGPPAVLVGQSMGGMAITQAAARSPEQVAQLIYVSGFIPQQGQSLSDLLSLPEASGDQVQANLFVAGDPPIALLPARAAPEVLYHCATSEQASWAAERLGPQAVAAFAEPLHTGDHLEALRRIPRAYVSCLRDRAIPVAMQRRMYSEARCDPVIELDTDHSPWLSRPDELVTALDRIAAVRVVAPSPA